MTEFFGLKFKMALDSNVVKVKFKSCVAGKKRNDWMLMRCVTVRYTSLYSNIFRKRKR